MLHTIDKVNGHIIQKITYPDGKLLRYQVVREEHIGNTPMVHPFSTLEAARKHAGFQHRLPAFVTQPKSANPQNQTA